MNNNKLTPGDIVLLASGVVLFIASFLHFYGASSDLGLSAASAWSKHLFPLFAIPAVLALLIVVEVALDRFSSVNLPHHVAGLTWKQLNLVVSIWAAVMLGSLFVGKLLFSYQGVSVSGPDKSVGFSVPRVRALMD